METGFLGLGSANLPQFSLQDLPCSVSRQRINENERLWRFVARQALLAMREEFFLARARASAQHDKRGDCFAPIVIRETDGGFPPDRRVRDVSLALPMQRPSCQDGLRRPLGYRLRLSRAGMSGEGSSTAWPPPREVQGVGGGAIRASLPLPCAATSPTGYDCDWPDG